MKKILLSIVAIATLSLSTFGQAPEGFKYQAVVRDAGGLILNNQAVGMRLTIQQGSIGGTAVYTETFSPTTNGYGLVNLEIGTGTTSDDFIAIDWANGPYFMETAVDVTGGTTWVVMGTSQLLSVPYALHSRTAENVLNDAVDDADADATNEIQDLQLTTGHILTITNNGTATSIDLSGYVDNTDTQIDSTGVATLGFVAGPHTDSITIANMGFVTSASGSSTDNFYLGQDTLGGIVYYIYKDATGEQHGLIVNKTESTAVWQATATPTGASRSWDGAFNTALMTSSAAATYVNGLTDGGFSDWYLPSIDELSSLWHSRLTTNKALNAIGGATLLSNTAVYWSSTEYSTTCAYLFDFFNGYATNFDFDKTNTFSVRAVRAF